MERRILSVTPHDADGTMDLVIFPKGEDGEDPCCLLAHHSLVLLVGFGKDSSPPQESLISPSSDSLVHCPQLGTSEIRKRP